MRVYPHEFFGNKNYKIRPNMCFVIMPFTETWSDRIYKLLKKIVNSLGYECIRADDVYGSIVLKDIWQKINEAGFIIADLSKEIPTFIMN